MPTLLTVFGAMLIVSAGVAGWLTWRAYGSHGAAHSEAAESADTQAPVSAPAANASVDGSTDKTVIKPIPTQAPAPPPEAAPVVKRFQLVCVSGALSGTAFSVGDECLISRGPVCWIAIPDTTLSAPHVAIDLSHQPMRVKDLNSRNGVKLGHNKLGGNFVDLSANQPLDAGALSLMVESGVLKVTGGTLQGKSYAMPATFVVVTRREMPVVITGDIDHRISDAHALMYVDNDVLMVKDLNSSNGTRVNQKRITQPAPVQAGDIVELGQSAFKVTAL